MANPKPISEVRIGRVKAAIWPNETEGRTRHNVTFSRLYKDYDQWKSTQSFSRNDLLLPCQSGQSGPLAYLRASAGRRASGRILVRRASESGGAIPAAIRWAGKARKTHPDLGTEIRGPSM